MIHESCFMKTYITDERIGFYRNPTKGMNLEDTQTCYELRHVILRGSTWYKHGSLQEDLEFLLEILGSCCHGK